MCTFFDLKKKEDSDSEESPAKKKRYKTGYQLYSDAVRDDTKQKLADESGEKPKGPAIMKELGSMWQALDELEKEGWVEKAAEIKAADLKAADESKKDEA